jgi:hypothetical protein
MSATEPSTEDRHYEKKPRADGSVDRIRVRGAGLWIPGLSVRWGLEQRGNRKLRVGGCAGLVDRKSGVHLQPLVYSDQQEHGQVHSPRAGIRFSDWGVLDQSGRTGRICSGTAASGPNLLSSPSGSAATRVRWSRRRLLSASGDAATVRPAFRRLLSAPTDATGSATGTARLFRSSARRGSPGVRGGRLSRSTRTSRVRCSAANLPARAGFGPVLLPRWKLIFLRVRG